MTAVSAPPASSTRADGYMRLVPLLLLVVGTVVALAYPLLYFLDRNVPPNVYGYPGGGVIAGMTVLIAGALIASRMPRHPVGWFFTAAGFLLVLATFAPVYALYDFRVNPGSLPLGTFVAWIGSWLWTPGVGICATLLLLFFPNGRLPSVRWRPLLWYVVVVLPLFVAAIAFQEFPLHGVDLGADGQIKVGGQQATSVQGAGALSVVFPLLAVAAVACIVSLGSRYRSAMAVERQQLKWFFYCGAIFAAAVLFETLGGFISPLYKPAAAVLIATFPVIPIGAGIAILRHGLYDIDVVISRTLVYVSLAALITMVYVAIAVGIGALVGSGGKPNLWLSILATAIVAVGFQPVRQRMQRVANRLVYGARATPYEALSQFSQRAAESYTLDDVLPRMARVLAEGTGAERAVVWLRTPTALRAAASWPADAVAPDTVALNGSSELLIPGAARTSPVNDQAELLGALSVVKRRGEGLSPIESKLMDDLAHQAGLVMKNASLAADLQGRMEELRASRQRLVAVQDMERRRLERNLHDGAQQHLVALKVKIGLAETLAARDPEKAKATLEQLRCDADEALQTLRDLAHGIYPPLLADRGLGAALEAQARRATVPVTVDAAGVGRHPQDVEAAVYFCCLEALQNAQKYANAHAVQIEICEDAGTLRFRVSDDGRGFDAATTPAGAGLTNMRDRVEAMGGSLLVTAHPGAGTRISGSLPAALVATG